MKSTRCKMRLEGVIDNASVTDMLVIGKHYYFDISPVPEASAQ